MLGLMVFSIAMGAVVSKLPEKVAPFKNLIDSLEEILLQVTNWISR